MEICTRAPMTFDKRGEFHTVFVTIYLPSILVITQKKKSLAIQLEQFYTYLIDSVVGIVP